MRRLARICENLVGIGIGALVLFTPFAFGSVETWASVVMITTILVLGVVWLVGRYASGRTIAGTGLEIPIALFFALVLFQLVPLPRPLLSIVSPRIEALYEKTVPGVPIGGKEFEDWLLASDSSTAPPAAVAGRATPQPLTYSVPDTMDRLLLFSAFAVLFLLVADLFRDREKRLRLIVWIVCVGCAVGIEGIFQKLAWNGKVLWLRSPPTGTRPFGPFVNPNHFAGYMELIVPVALGLLLTLLSRRARRSGGDEPPGSAPDDEGEAWQKLRSTKAEWNERLPWIARSSRPKALILAFFLSLSVVSILLSLSRGGILATLATFVLFSGVLVPPLLRQGRRIVVTGLVAGFMVAATVGIAAWIGSTAIAERFESLTTAGTEPSFLGRFEVWKRTIEAVREHAVLGSGLGSFEVVFVAYAGAGSNHVWAQAHNDYLQLLLEVGVVGAVLALLALAVFVTRILIPLVRDQSRSDWYLTIGLAMALVSMLLHSLVDFSLQIPAVGFLFVVLAGLLAALSRGDRQPGPGRAQSGARTAALAAVIVAVSAFAVVSAVHGARMMKGERLIRAGTQLADSKQALALFDAGMRASPGTPRIVTSFPDLAVTVFDQTYSPPFRNVEEARDLLVRSRDAYGRLITITPCSSWGWWGLGQVYRRLALVDRREAASSLERLIPENEEALGREARLGLAALKRALYLDPSPEIYDELAKLYFDEGLRSTALETYSTSMKLLPNIASHDFGPAVDMPDDVYRAIVAGMEGAIRDATVREPAIVQQQIGDLASQRRDLDEAERRYRLGLASARTRLGEEVLTLRIGEALWVKRQYMQAIPYLERASRSRTIGWWGWLRLGDVHSATGDHAKALLAYATAARLSPSDSRPVVAIARETALSGDRKDAIGQLRYLVGADQGGLPARELLVQVLRDDGRRKEALAEAQALQRLAPGKREYQKLVEQIENESGG